MKSKFFCILVLLLLTSTFVAGSNFQQAKAGPSSQTDALATNTVVATVYPDNSWVFWRHDLNNTGYSPSATLVTNASLWNFTTGDAPIYGTPVIVNNRIFVGVGVSLGGSSLAGQMLCLNQTDGSLIWNFTTYGNGASFPQGILDSAAVVNGQVYFGAQDGYVYALNATTGSLEWKTLVAIDVLGHVECVGLSSPAVYNGVVVIGSQNSQHVWALNASTGAVIWETQVSDSQVSSTAAISNGLVYINDAGYYLYAINFTTGHIVWSFTTHNFPATDSSVAVQNGLVYYGGSGNDNMYALNATTGKTVWNYTTGNKIEGSPSIMGNSIFFGGLDGYVYALNSRSGALIWKYQTGGQIISSPALSNTTLYIPSNDGFLYALNCSTGALVWKYIIGPYGHLWSYGVFSPSISGSYLYVGGYSQRLNQFQLFAIGTDTITINPNGGITPSNANITNSGNVTYTFTGNNYLPIVVNRSNIIINGMGYTLQASRENGFSLTGVSNVTIKNTTITNSYYGIYLYSSSGNVLSGNIVTANYFGIYLYFSSDNNTLSGNSVTANSWYGIVLEYSSGNVLSANNITANSYYGIDLEDYSDNNVLSGNNVTANSYEGIEIASSSGNTLSGNVMANNSHNFGVYGSVLSDFVNNIYNSNLVDGKPVYYLMNRSNIAISPQTYPEGVGYVGLVNCANVTVQGLTLTENVQGLLLAFTNDLKITHNNFTANVCGIYLYSSSGNVLSANNITANSYYGIFLDYSSGNVLSGNNVTANGEIGIILDSSSGNVLSGNSVTANSWYGIVLEYSSGNVLSGNVTANYFGIYLDSSEGNTFFHNNFIDNTQQVSSDGSPNTWDNGYPSGGNYWSDYHGVDACCGPYQNRTGSDGIGDTPYSIDANNTDYYPFMQPSGWENYPIPIESNVTVTGRVFGLTTLNFTVSGPSGEIGYVNATMPVEFNTTAIRVFIDGRPVQAPFPTITTNGTDYFIYFTFTLSTHQVAIQFGSHDVAVTDVKPLRIAVVQGFTDTINVTVANQGAYAETFNATLYANNTAIETITVIRASTLTFTWNTTGFAKGNYTISANVTLIPGEKNIWTGPFTYGTMQITKVGNLGSRVYNATSGEYQNEFGVFSGTIGPADLQLFLQCYHGTAPAQWMYLAELGNRVEVSPGVYENEFFVYSAVIGPADLSLFLQCYHGTGP